MRPRPSVGTGDYIQHLTRDINGGYDQVESTARDRTTALLEQADRTDPGKALDRVLPFVYEELRRMARRQLAGERQGHTLNTTALVHEAYVRLVDDTRVTRKGRSYFFGAAARAMRQILVDHARRHRAAKRGGDADPVTLEPGQGAIRADRFPRDADDLRVEHLVDQLIDLDRALDELAELNPRQARVVECRFFGGLQVDETADALGVSPRTVKYDWALARAWLKEALEGGSS